MLLSDAVSSSEHTGRAPGVCQRLQLQDPGHNLKRGAVQLSHSVVKEEPLLLEYHLSARSIKIEKMRLLLG